MANNNLIWAILLIIIIFFSSSQTQTSPSNGVDLSDVVDSSVLFTASDKYLAGTALTGENIQIVKNGLSRKSLGFVSLDSGTFSTEPEATYKLYYGINSTGPSATYYMKSVEYVAPVQDAQDSEHGELCKIDNSLSLATTDENGNVQSSTANALSMTTSETKTITLKLKSRTERCYGSPDAPKGNALCFAYNPSPFTSIELDTKKTTTPSSVSDNTTQTGISCYEFDLLEDGESIEVAVTLTSSAVEPTNAHNITVFSEDVALDLDQDTLQEIYNYEDEDNNDIGATLQQLGTIYIS